jgi:hypothetical protein
MAVPLDCLDEDRHQRTHTVCPKSGPMPPRPRSAPRAQRHRKFDGQAAVCHVGSPAQSATDASHACGDSRSPPQTRPVSDSTRPDLPSRTGLLPCRRREETKPRCGQGIAGSALRCRQPPALSRRRARFAVAQAAQRCDFALATGRDLANIGSIAL